MCGPVLGAATAFRAPSRCEDVVHPHVLVKSLTKNRKYYGIKRIKKNKTNKCSVSREKKDVNIEVDLGYGRLAGFRCFQGIMRWGERSQKQQQMQIPRALMVPCSGSRTAGP